MNPKLLSILESKCQQVLSANSRFHDYGHALEVLKNTKKILQFEKSDEDVLFTAALFHDVSNQSGSNEGKESAEITQKILNSIPEFPQEKIPDVCRLILSIDSKAETADELIINEADRMAIFSKLSIVRAFMLYGRKGVQPKEAIENFLAYIDRKYQNFKLPQAKKLVENDYLFIRNFLIDILQQYS